MPCSGEDGLIALLMAIAAEKSAIERRWVDFNELPLSQIHCDPTGTDCAVDSNEEPHPLSGSWTQDAAQLINPQGSTKGEKREIAA